MKRLFFFFLFVSFFFGLMGCSTIDITFDPNAKTEKMEENTGDNNSVVLPVTKPKTLPPKLELEKEGKSKEDWDQLFGVVFVGEEEVVSKPYSNLKKPKALKLKKQKEEVLFEKTVVEEINYGRFKMIKYSDETTTVVGGVFIPKKLPKAFFEQEKIKTFSSVLIVDYDEKTLEYYEKGKPVVGYAVVTPDPSYLPQKEVLGVVKKIDKNPSWCPPQSVREKHSDLPKGCLPAGHQDNAMGVIKFIISWQEVRGWEAVRIHGTNGYPFNFFEEETFGCVRLQNTAIKDLVKKMEKAKDKNPVEEGIVVISFRH